MEKCLTVIRGETKQNTPGRNRTCDTRFRKPVLYPTELRGQTLPNRSDENKPNAGSHLSQVATMLPAAYSESNETR